jgi:hypothetical protein
VELARPKEVKVCVFAPIVLSVFMLGLKNLEWPPAEVDLEFVAANSEVWIFRRSEEVKACAPVVVKNAVGSLKNVGEKYCML